MFLNVLYERHKWTTLTSALAVSIQVRAQLTQTQKHLCTRHAASTTANDFFREGEDKYELLMSYFRPLIMALCMWWEAGTVGGGDKR